jgi:transposase
VQLISKPLQGAACPCARTSQVCRKLLSAEAALGSFAAAEGVPPRNNATERALRHGVIRRKTGYGTDGEAWSGFVGRMLTVVATYRQRGCDALDFLTTCLRASLDGTPHRRSRPERQTDHRHDRLRP